MPDWIVALVLFAVGFPAGIWLYFSLREWRDRRTPYPEDTLWDLPPQAFGIRADDGSTWRE